MTALFASPPIHRAAMPQRARLLQSPDLLVLAALLALTASFGRPFSKLGIGEANLYVTEVALAIIGILAISRHGPKALVQRIRRVVPLVPVLVFWLAGLVAAVRGLRDFGFSNVLHDIGLVEYSIFVPIVAVVVDRAEKARFLLLVLLAAGLGSALVFTFGYFVDPDSPVVLGNGDAAVGLYIALFCVAVAAHLSHGRRISPLGLVAFAFALVVMSLTASKAVLLAMLISAMVLVALAPARRRIVTGVGALAAIAFSVGAAFAIERAGIGRESVAIEPLPTPVADPDFVADDGASWVSGGRAVVGDAAEGRESRQLRRLEGFEIPGLRGLARGQPYAITFAVRPLAPRVTYGYVGDTAGRGWGAVRWIAAPTARWQRFR